jgi:hypothetical protein
MIAFGLTAWFQHLYNQDKNPKIEIMFHYASVSVSVLLFYNTAYSKWFIKSGAKFFVYL